MRFLASAAITGVLLLAPGMALAACPGNTQSELSQCAMADHQRAEADLTRAYARLKKNPNLVAAQKAWIAYRDAECRYAHNATPSGSMYGMEESICRASMARERSKRLHAHMSEGYSRE
jgi:uncharacterized protein YecT (DUF1311 family)